MSEFKQINPEAKPVALKQMKTKLSGKVIAMIAGALGIGSIGGGVLDESVMDLFSGHDHKAEVEQIMAEHMASHHADSVPAVVPITAPGECTAEVRIDQDMLDRFCGTNDEGS